MVESVDVTSKPGRLEALLPQGLAAKVEKTLGASITGIKPRGGGGASREGAELSLVFPDGRELRAYMNYDVHRAGAGDDAAFLREAAILRALSGPLIGTGVRTARFIAAIPEARALINEYISGESNFNKLRTPEDRLAVAGDFMTQLARLHAIDISTVTIEGMGEPRPISHMVRDRLDDLRKNNQLSRNDPLVATTLAWLEENTPPDLARNVIVHGDAGPANFLYEEGRVTALLDWELVQYGDPMADLAMLCLRMLFQPFIPLPVAFAIYEASGGQEIDLSRIRFWRLFFQVGFVAHADHQNPDAPPPPNLGMNMVYSTIHRRVLSEALAEAAGVKLSPVHIPEAPPGAHERSFQIALDDLRDTIVPRIDDQQAAVKAKGLARLVKWWRDIERFGPSFEAAELGELREALGRQFSTLGDARMALSTALQSRALDRPAIIRLCHARATRDAALMEDAMGKLAVTHLGALE